MASSGWSDRELLICLLNLVDMDSVKLRYEDGVYPPNRNANGFRQKITALKKDMRTEIAAYQGGNPVDSTPKKSSGTDKPKATPRKRKNGNAEGEDGSPKKRGRPKKQSPVEVEEEESEEMMPIKGEPGEEVDEV